MGNVWRILALLRTITPEMRAAIRGCLDTMEEQARSTRNPVDDAAVGLVRLLCWLLGVV